MRFKENSGQVGQSDQDRISPLTQLMAFSLGLTVAFASLALVFSGKKTDFEDAAAMGAETTTVMPSVEGHKIHCYDSRDAEDCISGAKARKAERSVLWLGNSQLHAINQWKNGETNASAILFESLKKAGLDLITFSQPNANLQEHDTLFEYLRQQLPVKVLILPLVFDDTREDGLRPEVERLAHGVMSALNSVKTNTGKDTLEAQTAGTHGHETSGISDTLQERVELILNNSLTQHSRLWEARPEMRGWIFNQLYFLRNTLFGIKPTTKRKLILGRYIKNLAALENILSTAAEADIAVVMYVAPIRNDVEIPYLADEYQKFKSDARDLAEKYRAVLANLENLVPKEHWGHKDATSMDGEAELDFMHFQAGGHRLLAAEMAELVLRAIADRKARQ